MPRASKRKVEKDLNLELENQFAGLISELNNPKDIKGFFEHFLTREEKIMLMKRLMLHLMIELGYKTYEIDNVLKICRETIRSHRQKRNNGGEVYRKILVKLIKKNKDREVWQKINKILKSLDVLFTFKTNMKSRAKLYNGNIFDD